VLAKTKYVDIYKIQSALKMLAEQGIEDATAEPIEGWTDGV